MSTINETNVAQTVPQEENSGKSSTRWTRRGSRHRKPKQCHMHDVGGVGGVSPKCRKQGSALTAENPTQ